MVGTVLAHNDVLSGPKKILTREKVAEWLRGIKITKQFLIFSVPSCVQVLIKLQQESLPLPEQS